MNEHAFSTKFLKLFEDVWRNCFFWNVEKATQVRHHLRIIYSQYLLLQYNVNWNVGKEASDIKTY